MPFTLDDLSTDDTIPFDYFGFFFKFYICSRKLTRTPIVIVVFCSNSIVPPPPLSILIKRQVSFLTGGGKKM